MKRRFVGVDPYIERQCWVDFHHEMIVSIRALLMPQLIPKYIAQIEERVYLETHPPESVRRVFRPDVGILQIQPQAPSPTSTTTLTETEPTLLTLPMPEQQREPYITIVTNADRQLVTIIELLSPSNKNPNADGRREYLAKRQQVLQTEVHLVEVDLLLQGERLPTVEPLPQADFYVFVARGNRRPVVEVYSWTLAQPLPIVPIPLLPEDPDVWLNLQEAYEQTFARARYDVRLRYEEEP